MHRIHHIMYIPIPTKLCFDQNFVLNDQTEIILKTAPENVAIDNIDLANSSGLLFPKQGMTAWHTSAVVF